MTPIQSHLFVFIFGLLVAILFSWVVHRKQQKDWQAEYQRLMVGIKENAVKVLIPTKYSRERISIILMKLYNNEINWPRE